MKLKDVFTLYTKSVTPTADKKYHLYSLPAFDNNQKREEVGGTEILSNKFSVPNKCILFNKLNVRFKRVWVVSNEDENKLASTEFFPLVVNEDKIDFLYAYYLLISNFVTNFLSEQHSNTSQSHKRIDSDLLFSIDVELPPMKVQKAIGKFLNDLDSKITLNREINRNLEAMARQLYDYWFVQFDFPDENGRPYKSSGGKMVWNEKLKREIPEGWSSTSIILYASIQNGATPSTKDEANYGGDIVWITPKDLSDQSQKFTFIGERTITRKGYKSCSTTMLPKESILMSSRAPIGLLSIAAVELCTNQGFKSIVPKDQIFSRFLYYMINHHLPIIKQMGSGTTFSEISKEELSKLNIPNVPTNIIKEWDLIVSPIFQRQEKLLLESSELTKQRDELLPLLMNGQVNCDLSLD